MNIIKTRSELIRGLTIYDLELNVGYYARVSTDKDDQLNSLENQSNYFKEMIAENKKWNLVGEYIDEGISGTAVKNRDSFLRMIEDASLGKIDLILTKEISRFSRNTVDSIKYTEELLSYGTVVYFISDNLNTIYPDSEFRLAIMASLAQDEVRKLSERVKFGIKRMIKDGKLIGGNLTGYHRKNGKFIINEEERPMIELIFNLYSTGNYSFAKIAKLLKSKGYLNSKGKEYSGTTLKNILTNPRYKGYYTANLTNVENYKTHKKIKTSADEQIIYKDFETCPPIISEELWNKANKIYNNKNNSKSKYNLNRQDYIDNGIYTNKLICKEHNKHFTRFGSNKRRNNPAWMCMEYKQNGITKCASPIIKERVLDVFMIKLVEKEVKNLGNIKKLILNDYKEIIETAMNNELTTIKEKIKVLEINKERLINLNVEGILSTDELKTRLEKINDNITKLKNGNVTPVTGINPTTTVRLNNIENELEVLLDVENNLKNFLDTFINKVIISKINDSRYKLNLEVEFKYLDNIKIIEFIN